MKWLLCVLLVSFSSSVLAQSESRHRQKCQSEATEICYTEEGIIPMEKCLRKTDNFQRLSYECKSYWTSYLSDVDKERGKEFSNNYQSPTASGRKHTLRLSWLLILAPLVITVGILGYILNLLK